MIKIAKLLPTRPCGHPSDTGLISADPKTGKVEVYCWLCIVDAINELYGYRKIKPFTTTTIDELEKKYGGR